MWWSLFGLLLINLFSDYILFSSIISVPPPPPLLPFTHYYSAFWALVTVSPCLFRVQESLRFGYSFAVCSEQAEPIHALHISTIGWMNQSKLEKPKLVISSQTPCVSPVMFKNAYGYRDVCSALAIFVVVVGFVFVFVFCFFGKKVSPIPFPNQMNLGDITFHHYYNYTMYAKNSLGLKEFAEITHSK